jgi:hypothetical protein
MDLLIKIKYIYKKNKNNMENKSYYIASKGMVYKRKSDNKIVGKYINLNQTIDGSIDTIDNYEEVVDERYLKMKELIEKPLDEIDNPSDRRRAEILKKIMDRKNKIMERISKRRESHNTMKKEKSVETN